MTQLLLKPVAKKFQTQKVPALIPLLTSFEIFTDKDYLNGIRLFYAYFDKVPNSKTISDLECSGVRKWMEAEMSINVLNIHSREHYGQVKKKTTYNKTIYILKNNLLLSLEADSAQVVYACGNEQPAQDLLDRLKTFTKKDKPTKEISIIIPGFSFLHTTPLKIKMPKLNIGTHYNDDLGPIHENILKNLRRKDTKGLYLFHGVPGTGKSTYIRFLIHQLKKKVIFVPAKQASNLESPEFTLLMSENRNAVFIIEDAEELIVSRESGPGSTVSSLLNLSDGLLSESLGIQVIASFNTNITNVDKALLRKGRLTVLYEFRELSQPKASALLDVIGFPCYKATKPMTLAEIYNFAEESYQIKSERIPIGFGRPTEADQER